VQVARTVGEPLDRGEFAIGAGTAHADFVVPLAVSPLPDGAVRAELGTG
jgi:hypothetical protein